MKGKLVKLCKLSLIAGIILYVSFGIGATLATIVAYIILAFQGSAPEGGLEAILLYCLPFLVVIGLILSMPYNKNWWFVKYAKLPKFKKYKHKH